jgi:hypothetical protein
LSPPRRKDFLISRIAPKHASLAAYPSITAAARMIGVAASTLSRREDLNAEARGERDRVLSPIEVLRLGTIYRKRSLNEVAQELIEHAREVSVEGGTKVEAEVEAFFEERVGSDKAREDVLAAAQRLLEPEAFERVKAALSEPAEPLPESFSGNYPPLD